MIGLVVIGPHNRLREAYKTGGSPKGIIIRRLAELDLVHPRDFGAVLEVLPETLTCWTNNPAVLDAVPVERICVLTEKGPRPFKEHRSYETYCVAANWKRSAFWLLFGEEGWDGWG